MKIPEWIEKIRTRDARWPFLIIAALISVAAILTSGLLKGPDPADYTMAQYMQSQYNVVKARVISVDDSRLEDEPYIKGMKIGVQPVRIEIIRGEHKGRVFDIDNTMNRAVNIRLKEGMTFLCLVQEENGELQRVEVYGYSRDTAIYGLALVFLAVMLLVGRKKGFYSMVSLAFAVIMIIFFLIPRILAGYDPVFMAITASIIITAVSMFIVSGCTAKSISAIIGVVLGVAMAGLTSVIAGKLTNISGVNASEAEEMISLASTLPIKVPGLLFAGIIISALGAIMDTGMSISSTVFEDKSKSPKLSVKELYKSGMKASRDVIGAKINTLILAFAGSSLIVILLTMLYYMPYLRLINLDLLGLGIIRGLSGSIGLVLTVPLTAICAAFIASKTQQHQQNQQHNERMKRK